MDDNPMRLGLTLAIAAALFFSFFVLRRFLGIMRFSLRAVLCLALVGGVAALIWSQRVSTIKQENVIDSQPIYQSQRDVNVE